MRASPQKRWLQTKSSCHYPCSFHNVVVVADDDELARDSNKIMLNRLEGGLFNLFVHRNGQPIQSSL